MAQAEAIDLKVSGVGSASGGTYANVRVEGVGRIHGDVECTNCSIDGVANLAGGIKAQHVVVNGKANIHGNVVAEDVELHGLIRVDGNCEAETFHADGGLTLGGLLNAGTIDMVLHGSISIKEVGCDSIHVRRIRKFGLFSFLRRFNVDAVEGDSLQLEYTHAKVVRGNIVELGPGCEVDLVEYRTDLKLADGVKVGETRKLQ